MSDELLTLDEIFARHPNEWILIGDLISDEQTLKPLVGRILFHAPTRDEVDRKAIELHPKRFAIRYAGVVITRFLVPTEIQQTDAEPHH
jgi:hypothetical protein